MEFPKITRLIPQRPPFLMVDSIRECGGPDAVTSFVILQDNMLVDDGALSTAGIVENMAQSCAARMGCIDWMNGEPIKIGYIGDVKNCSIMRHPVCGETLHTEVHIIEEMFGLVLAEVTTKVNDETLATAHLKIAMTDIVADLED